MRRMIDMKWAWFAVLGWWLWIPIDSYMGWWTSAPLKEHIKEAVLVTYFVGMLSLIASRRCEIRE